MIYDGGAIPMRPIRAKWPLARVAAHQSRAENGDLYMNVRSGENALILNSADKHGYFAGEELPAIAIVNRPEAPNAQPVQVPAESDGDRGTLAGEAVQEESRPVEYDASAVARLRGNVDKGAARARTGEFIKAEG